MKIDKFVNWNCKVLIVNGIGFLIVKDWCWNIRNGIVFFDSKKLICLIRNGNYDYF